jgi:divalent metal cation (Fe/Co/Zn/Cd) transporter
MSWLFSGLLVLAGVAFAWVYLDYEYEGRFEHDQLFGKLEAIPPEYTVVLGTAGAVLLLLATATMAFFNRRKAKRLHAPVWDAAAWNMLAAFCLPVFTGAAFGFVLVFKYGLFGLVAPISLLFYGLGLAQAAVHTLPALRYLGFAEIGLGLASCFLPRETLIFWGLGFGVFHVLFGLAMVLQREG